MSMHIHETLTLQKTHNVTEGHIINTSDNVITAAEGWEYQFVANGKHKVLTGRNRRIQWHVRQKMNEMRVDWHKS